MDFTDTQLHRYSRHIILPDVGGIGQTKLLNSKVLVVGAGGLGSPLLLYLAAAGVGTIGIVDDDSVDLSNLQRQIIHDETTLGVAKVESAAARIAALNPDVTVEAHKTRITKDNALDLIGRYDVVADGSDNFATRYAAADAAEAARIPLVTGAVGRFDGSVTVLKPYEADDKGEPHPRYRDLFPEAPPEGLIPSCAEAGIIGALTGVIGTLMAMEAIKLVTGIGEPLVGRLLLYDGLSARFDTIRYRRRKGNAGA